jgi:hypothetical protein
VGKRGDAKEKRTRKYSSRRRKKEILYIYKKRRRRNGTRYIAPPQKNPQNERPFLFSCPWPSALITRYKTLGADIVSVLVNSNFGDLSLAVRPSARLCIFFFCWRWRETKSDGEKEKCVENSKRVARLLHGYIGVPTTDKRKKRRHEAGPRLMMTHGQRI